MTDEGKGLTEEDVAKIAAALAGARHLDVLVAAVVTGADELQYAKAADFEIPLDYTEQDVKAAISATVAQAAYALGREAFGFSPQEHALVAATARLAGFASKLLGVPLDGTPRGILASALQQILDLSNDDAIAQHGDEAPVNQ